MTHDEREHILSLSTKTRESLCATIEHLEVAKAELEDRLNAARACDPMQVVTGKTSIETALEVTQRMLDRLDCTFQRAQDAVERAQRTSLNGEAALNGETGLNGAANLDGQSANGHGGAHANHVNNDADPLRVTTVPSAFPGSRVHRSISPA